MQPKRTTEQAARGRKRFLGGLRQPPDQVTAAKCRLHDAHDLQPERACAGAVDGGRRKVIRGNHGGQTHPQAKTKEADRVKRVHAGLAFSAARATARVNLPSGGAAAD